jgi:hypothetical protein
VSTGADATECDRADSPTVAVGLSHGPLVASPAPSRAVQTRGAVRHEKDSLEEDDQQDDDDQERSKPYVHGYSLPIAALRQSVAIPPPHPADRVPYWSRLPPGA